MKEREAEKTMSIVTCGPRPSPWKNGPNLYSLMPQMSKSLLHLHPPQETKTTRRREKAPEDDENRHERRRRAAETLWTT